MIKWLLGALLLLAPSLALAQNQGQIVPSGQFTPGHTVRCQNSTCTVIVDGGGSAGSNISGQGYLAEIGITNTGTPFCINDALTSDPNGYHQFCLGANALGGGLISYNAYGGASPLGLTVNLNGVNYPFPGSGLGNVTGPTSPLPTANDVVLWNGGTAVKDAGVPLTRGYADVREYGAAPGNSAAANTTAIQNCLNAAANYAGFNTCLASARYAVNSLSIPAATILRCQDAPTFVEGQGAQGAKWNSVPALLLASTAQIAASGDGAGLVNCNVLNSSLTFPLGTSARASYGSGIAVTDNGWASFRLTGDRIAGWDAVFKATGAQPTVDDLYFDGNGQNNGGALIISTGNTNIGIWTRVQSGIGFFFDTATNFPTNFCAELPPGTGVYFGGTPDATAGAYIDKFVIVGYEVNNFNFANSAIAGAIFSDNFTQAPYSCSQPSAIGILTGATPVTLTADQVNISEGQIGWKILTNFVHVTELQIGGTLGDAIQLGDGSHGGLRVRFGNVIFNGIGGYCINQAGQQSGLSANHIDAFGCNGSAFPYFQNSSGLNNLLARGNPLFWDIHSLATDQTLPYSTSPYASTIVAGLGSEGAISFILPSVSACTGIGTGGSPSCGIDTNGDVTDGTYKFHTGTTGMAAAGQFTVTDPISPANAKTCNLTLDAAFPTTTSLISGAHGTTVFWTTNGAALSANTDYFIIYHCAFY